MKIDRIVLESVDSTMDYAKKNSLSFNKKNLTIIIAKEQTKGRGRFQRSWVSPKGENIYATFYFHLKKENPFIPSFAQFMTLCIARVLLKERVSLSLRWPNDILIHDKKLAGVLCEVTRKNSAPDIFLGFGVNVDTPVEVLATIENPATCLKKETQKNWGKEDLLEKIEKQFLEDLPLFLDQGFKAFSSEFNQLLAYRKKQVVCSDGQNQWVGICDSVTGEGMLNLHLLDGSIKILSSADVSLKKRERS